MTELEIPPDAGADRASDLVAEFVELGDRVEVEGTEAAAFDDEGRLQVRGQVTALEPAYLELDGDSLDGKSVRYDEIHLLTRLG